MLDWTPVGKGPTARYLRALQSRELAPANRRLARAAELLGINRSDFVPHELRVQDIVRVRDEMFYRNASPTAINNMLETLKGVARAAFELGGVCEEDLIAIEAVPGAPDTQRQRRLLTGQEFSAVVGVCLWEGSLKGVRDAAIILTLYAGGLSAKEIVSLGMDAFQREKDLLKVRAEGHKEGRPVPLGTDAGDVLRRWLSFRGAFPGRLFLPLDDAERVVGDRLHAAVINGILVRRAMQAEVDRFSCKDLRTTAAADMLRAGAEPREIGTILGKPVPRVSADENDVSAPGPMVRAVVLASEHIDYFDLIGSPNGRTVVAWGASEESSLANGWIDTSKSPPVPRLAGRVSTSTGEIAYGCIGRGRPMVLVHGSVGRALSWRGVASALTESHTVYAPDLPAHGESEYRYGQDVSIAAHARMLAELVEIWSISDYNSPPDMVGEGTGAAIVLRAYLLEGMPVRRMALLTPVVFAPWITEAERHVKDYPEAYLSMPEELFEALLQARAKEEVGSGAGSGAVEFFVSQWAGKRGRLAHVERAKALDESHSAELEPLLGSVNIPVLILSGADDTEEDNLPATRLKDAIRGARLGSIPWTQRLLAEEAPEDVAHALGCFFSTETPAARGY